MRRITRLMGTVALAIVALDLSIHAATPKAPDPGAIARAGEATFSKLSSNPARWVVRCQLAVDQAIVITVTQDGDRRLHVFEHRHGEKLAPLFKILDDGDTW